MGFTNVRPSMLDDFAWFEPFIESYTSEALPWAKTGAKHSFAEFPGLDDYVPLLAEFAEKCPRPVRSRAVQPAPNPPRRPIVPKLCRASCRECLFPYFSFP